MYKDKFVLSVLRNGSPIRESGPSYDRKVSIPFGSEYVIRLRNKNSMDCTARVFVDGTPLSSFGDFIIHANGYVDLERFVTESMSKGKKLKFVSLDHPRVNDPYSGDNGIIKVEFRLAKQRCLNINWNFPIDTPWPNHPFWYYEPTQGTGHPIPETRFTYSYGGSCSYDGVSNASKSFSNKCKSSSNTSRIHNELQDGATIEGRHSYQSFSYGDIDVEESPSAVLKLKIVGIKDKQKLHRHRSFCTNCGNPRRGKDKFCGQCGRRF